MSDNEKLDRLVNDMLTQVAEATSRDAVGRGASYCTVTVPDMANP